MTDYEALGGHDGLTRLITAFIERETDDFIVGFLFQGRDLERVVRHEVEHAAAHLGGPSAYTGRPIGAVHKPLRINAGHFRRRLAILRRVLEEHGVDEAIIGRWIAADQALEKAVTDGTDCVE